ARLRKRCKVGFSQSKFKSTKQAATDYQPPLAHARGHMLSGCGTNSQRGPTRQQGSDITSSNTSPPSNTAWAPETASSDTIGRAVLAQVSEAARTGGVKSAQILTLHLLSN